MAVPLISTKLHLPALRPRRVERPRLRGLMEKGAGAKLTLISAPAGFGKTTLLAEWLAGAPAADAALAWLSLDDTDNDPAMFWPHVLAAFQAAARRGQRSFPDLAGATQQDQSSFIAILLNHLAIDEGAWVLVLDDLHLVDRPDILAQLGSFIEHLPARVRVIISTRADPALPLARLRARGDLVEIRAADLRFTRPETLAYLNDVMRLDLSEQDAEILDRRTEGWIAALQLAVISLDGRSDASSFISGFAGSGRFVVDYLVEEVLLRLPDDLRRFLLATCVLRRMSASLCDAVTGAPGTSRRMLDRLERQNLFLVPLDEGRQWYRYHHLFADVLVSHLAEGQSGEMIECHRRASAWFETHGERAEAIHHALEAHDFEWAAELIERAIPDMRRSRQEALFLAWLGPIPDAVVRARPVLSVALAGVQLSLGQFEGVEDRLREAERQVAGREGTAGFLAHIELYRTALAQSRGDIDGAARHAGRVLDLAPADDHLSRAGASGFLGIVSWTRGDLEQAREHWTVCRDGMRHQGHIADVQGTSIALADILRTQGRLSEARRVAEEALALGMDKGRPIARGIADTQVSLSLTHYERNELPAARAHLEAGRALGEVFGLLQYPYRSRVAEACLEVAEGRPVPALELLEEAERRYVGDFFPYVRPIPALKARLNIRLGHLDDAERWAREAGVGIDDPASYIRECELLTLAQLHIARAADRADGGRRVLPLLDRLRTAAIAGGRTASRIEIMVLEAQAHRLAGDDAAALEMLAGALGLATPERIARPFIEDGPAIAGLLRLAARRQPRSPFLQSLLGGQPAATSVPAVDPAGPIEALSERELGVLRLLRGEMSGPEIARELAISLNTLRTHTKNIFDKLGVNSRRAAVRRAEELNLYARDTRR